MDSKSGSANHGLVFGILVVLVFLSVGISRLHLSGSMNNLVIFGIAFFMAGLVAVQYMNLKNEGKIIQWLVFIPLILFFILVVYQFPDIAHRPIPLLAPHLVER